MVATSGDRLLAADAVEALRTQLIPRASLITPNLPEAAALLDEPVAANEAAVENQGKRLLSMGCRAVLIKGGHGQGTESIDYLIDANGAIALAAPRIATKNTHGTGCSLSSAIAAGLANGEDDGSRRSQRQGVDQRGDRIRGSLQRRSRPRADPSFSQILLTVVPAKAGTHTPRLVCRAMGKKVVELKIVDRASDSTIGRTLKKTFSSPTADSAGSFRRRPIPRL